MVGGSQKNKENKQLKQENLKLERIDITIKSLKLFLRRALHCE